METNPEFHSVEDAKMQQHRRDVREAEDRIAALHERRGMSEQGDLGYEESFELSDLLTSLMGNGEEVLALGDKEAQEMRTVLRRLLKGPLDDADEQRLADWLSRYEQTRAEKGAY
ncbi:MAG: hypothetical protein EXS68_01500 [Candidatus Ryanbacteria bacterium]|nr:hypothetical protein [Candidatus Ryanbacteria bacterium]